MKSTNETYRKALQYVEHHVQSPLSSLIDTILSGSARDLEDIRDTLTEAISAADHDEECPVEVFEWWSVSYSAYCALRERGEVVCEIGRMYVWGRQTTGQRIAIDAVIESIAVPETRLEALRGATKECIDALNANLLDHGAQVLDTENGFILVDKGGHPVPAHRVRSLVETVMDDYAVETLMDSDDDSDDSDDGEDKSDE